MAEESRRFDSQEYLDAYHRDGAFPVIHNGIESAVLKHAPENEPCVDFGACIGLISARLIRRCGRSYALAVEGDPKNLARAVQHDAIQYFPFFVNGMTMPKLAVELKRVRPTLAVARRVLSEIGIRDPFVVTELARNLAEAGVRKMVIQGRVPVRRPIVPLHNTELEAKALAPYFKPVAWYGPVCVLEAQ